VDAKKSVLLVKAREGKVLPDGKTGVKTLLLFSPLIGEKRFEFSSRHTLFHSLKRLNDLASKHEKVILIGNKNFYRLFVAWYKAYFDYAFESVWFRQKLFRFSNEFVPPPNESEPFLSIFEKLSKGFLKEVRPQSFIRLETKRKKFLPEVREEILSVLNSVGDDELPLRVEEEKLLTGETLELLRELREKGERKIIDASQTVLVDGANGLTPKGEVRTDLVTISVFNVWRILSDFFFLKYLDLCKTFPQLYDRLPLTKAIERALPDRYKHKKFLAEFLSTLLKASNFEYSVSNCSVDVIAFSSFKKLIHNPHTEFPYEPSVNPEEEIKRLSAHLSDLLPLDGVELYRIVSRLILWAIKKRGTVIHAGEVIEDKKVAKLVNAFLNVVREFFTTYGKDPYAEAFFFKFSELLPQNVLSLPLCSVSSDELKRFGCLILNSTQSFRPKSRNVLKDLIERLPEPLKLPDTVYRALPDKLDLIGLYSKVLKVF